MDVLTRFEFELLRMIECLRKHKVESMLSLAFLVLLLFGYRVTKPDLYFLCPFYLNDGHDMLNVFSFVLPDGALQLIFLLIDYLIGTVDRSCFYLGQI